MLVQWHSHIDGQSNSDAPAVIVAKKLFSKIFASFYAKSPPPLELKEK
jgi:hypothetical protein